MNQRHHQYSKCDVHPPGSVGSTVAAYASRAHRGRFLNTVSSSIASGAALKLASSSCAYLSRCHHLTVRDSDTPPEAANECAPQLCASELDLITSRFRLAVEDT